MHNLYNGLIYSRLSTLVAILFLLGAWPVGAATNDIYPGDYYPGEPGDTTLSLYSYHRESDGPYAAGRKLLDGTLSGKIFAVRGVRTFDLAGMTASSVFALSWLDLSTRPVALADAIGNGLSGAGDLRLGLTLWPVKDRQNANYLGLSTMLIAPTGRYDGARQLNSGENRWRLVLSGGWQRDLNSRWLLEVMPELTLYGDNDDHAGGTRLEQEPAVALTGYLRWRLARSFHLHLGGQLNRGGATTVNGVDQNNASGSQRLYLGATWFLPEKQQLILRAARDIGVDNGFRIGRELALRYQKSF